jgi:hypothetical protein
MDLLWWFLLWDAPQKTPAPVVAGGTEGTPIGLLLTLTYAS